MRYITWADVTNRYKDAGQFDDATDMQATWIADAEDEIDGRLSLKYPVPFASTPTLTPALVKGLTADLVYLKMTVGKVDNKALQASWDDRMDDIVNNKLNIVALNGTVLDPAPLSWTDRDDFHGSFGVDDPVNWNVSSTWKLNNLSDRLHD